MEIVFGVIIAVIVIALIYFNRESKGLDINKDGKVDIQDAQEAVKNVKTGVEKAVKKPRKPRTTSKPATRGRRSNKA
jgi:hypothetical protein